MRARVNAIIQKTQVSPVRVLFCSIEVKYRFTHAEIAKSEFEKNNNEKAGEKRKRTETTLSCHLSSLSRR